MLPYSDMKFSVTYWVQYVDQYCVPIARELQTTVKGWPAVCMADEYHEWECNS